MSTSAKLNTDSQCKPALAPTCWCQDRSLSEKLNPTKKDLLLSELTKVINAGPSELTKVQRLRRNSNYFWHGLSTMTSHTHHSLSLVTAYSMERVSRRLTYRPLWTLLCIISRDHTLEFVVGVSLHVERYSSNILLWSCLSHIRPSLFSHVLCLACFFPMCVEFNVCGAIGAIGACMYTALKSWSILLSFRRSRAQLLIKNPTSIWEPIF